LDHGAVPVHGGGVSLEGLQLARTGEIPKTKGTGNRNRSQ